jgi:quinol monooxygenase YgiN
MWKSDDLRCCHDQSEARASCGLCRRCEGLHTETRKEPGCIAYDLHGSVSDPDTFVFVERWESHDHLAAHRLTPHLKAWRALSGPFKASPTAIEVIIGGEVQKLTS